MRSLILALTLLACTPGPTDTDTDTETDTDTDTDPPEEYVERTLDVYGAQREYLLFVPTTASQAMEEGPVPLLTVVHEDGDTPRNTLEWTGLDQLARDNGFVIVAPAGYDGGWYPAGNSWSGEDGLGTSFANDVMLIRDVVVATSAEFSIDPTRTVAVGHGMGSAMLVYHLMGTGFQTFAYDEVLETPYLAFGLNAGFDPSQDSIGGGHADPRRPAWITQGSEDHAWAFTGEELAEDLERYDFEVVYTEVEGAGHIWMWQEGLDQTNQDLWDWLMTKAAEQE